MQNRSYKLLTASVALGAAALTACSDAGTTSAGRGSLSLAITDAPFPFDSVARADIYVVRIDGKREDTDSTEAAANVAEDRQKGEEDRHGDSWVTLATPNQAINLLDLQNGKVMNLGQQSLPTGEYRGFRLVIDASKSSITLKNGTKPDIKWPSAERSGIKVKLERPITLTEGGTQMVIDFDLGKSFELRGKTVSEKGLLFKPVIRATAKDVTGHIGGSVHAGTATGAAVAGATVEVYKILADTLTVGSAVATTGSDAAGQYKVSFLLPGSYGVRVVPPTGSTNKGAAVADVAVTTGTTKTVDVVLP
jgi:hypothetical protein